MRTARISSGIDVEKPQNWLIKIAHNVARTRYARATRRVKEVPLDEHVELIAVPEEDLPDVREVLEALGRLPFNQRSALVMRELEGRTVRRDRRHDRRSGLRGRDIDLPGTAVLRLKASALRSLAVVPLPTSLAQFFDTGGVVAGRRRGRGRWTAPEGGGRARRRGSRHGHRQRSQRSRLRGTFFDSPDRRPFAAGCRRLPDARGSRRERLERRPSPWSKDRATRGARRLGIRSQRAGEPGQAHKPTLRRWPSRRRQAPPLVRRRSQARSARSPR